jgi:four helix bundle protein
MEYHDRNEFYQKFRARTKQFAINLCRSLNKVPQSFTTKILLGQIIRSGTSVAANFRSASRARSLSELYSKMCIVVEECDEVVFWLDILQETEDIPKDVINSFQNEALELLKVFSVSKKKLKSRKFPPQ